MDDVRGFRRISETVAACLEFDWYIFGLLFARLMHSVISHLSPSMHLCRRIIHGYQWYNRVEQISDDCLNKSSVTRVAPIVTCESLC